MHAPTAHGALHWAPLADDGYSDRMQAIADWVRDARPEVMVVDVSVEVAVLVRLLGVPVVVVALPGDRTDAPHRLVHTIADGIIAAWPRALRVPEWLRPHDDKTVYVGGISRFDGRSKELVGGAGQVVVLSGCGGSDSDPQQTPADWKWLGGPHGHWTPDPWPDLVGADVVVTHAGQNSIADIAAAQRPAVVIPQARPFDEQHTTATVLAQHELAVVAAEWPDRQSWPALMQRARAIEPKLWQQWQVSGAAARAAQAVEAVARQCRGRVPA